ncbi:class I SAM-dependent methyltransferase [Brucepastera parasyntrophica]|uniref:class I SAM-dependent methyltransferase n=1 Tax=Brucepastera parasyntrophica TaxID=2880008 RepID=UPI002108CC22|nr:class I SAM-dependent methyltransferase [Brucepastera parasyntrophica]ULQ58674.1 class I SAM-dependent methyltransferase [Brucepastera parasyntrophica]
MNENQIRTIESYNKTAEDFMKKIGTLNNYNSTYDYLISKINKNDDILDLACGPGQISKYIAERIKVHITGVDLSSEMLRLARENIPGGTFIEDSIIRFQPGKRFNAVVIGFGIPYLKKEEVRECIENSVSLLADDGHIYVSFMEGKNEGFEKTSFGGNNDFYLYYHTKTEVTELLRKNGIMVIKEFILDYTEPDGEITKDIILIGKK